VKRRHQKRKRRDPEGRRGVLTMSGHAAEQPSAAVAGDACAPLRESRMVQPWSVDAILIPTLRLKRHIAPQSNQHVYD